MMETDPDNPKLGVMYPSPLINLPKFDLVNGFIPDYLHMALEGIAKQFANFHLDELDANGTIPKIDSISNPHIGHDQFFARYLLSESEDGG
uniref:DNA-directed RNA polymerase n=1 Tax=Trichogramma kaykai TaxID=54128 RepID=A0ABD2WQL9_9HYME